MRFLRWVAFAPLLACSTDTFVAADGGDDRAVDSPIDVVVPDGAHADAGPTDPNTLGDKIVLWLIASEAKTALDGGDTVTMWPDHKGKQSTYVNIGATTSTCIAGLHASVSPILGKPTVTFCAANLAVSDSSSLQLGNNPFTVLAVFRPPTPSAGADYVLFAKVAPGGTLPLNGLSMLAPNSSGKLVGSLSTSVITASTNAIGTSFVYGGIVRNNQGVGVRVNGNPGPTISSSADVSAQNATVGVGGYMFDLGMVRNIFAGELAELVVVNDGSDVTVGIIESYFKLKYGL